MQNFYFTILAKSTTQADAIAEAYKFAKIAHTDSDISTGVEIRICGTKIPVAKVLPDGSVLSM